MNICHAYLFFSIRFAGGTSDLMYKICKAQEKQGNKPSIYTGNYEFDHELADKLPKTRFRVLKSYFNKMGFSIMPKLRSILEMDVNSIDVVHMHVFRTFQNVVLYYFCKRHNIPFIIDAHGAVPFYTRKRKLKKIFDLIWGRRMLREASFLIAETKVGIHEYMAVCSDIDKSKIKIISPPFDTDEFRILPKRGLFRRKFGIGENIKLIMFLGRVHHIKGNDFLIEAFHKFCEKNTGYKLAIVGSDDGHMEDCKRLVCDRGIQDKVLFTGFIEGIEKNEALVDADLVCQMSRQEQGAWAPFEAVLCGTPIIVSKNTGAGEDVKRVNAGSTVLFGDLLGMVQAMEEIFSDYQKYLKITYEAKRYIEEKMSMAARAHEYTDLYAEAIQKE